MKIRRASTFRVLLVIVLALAISLTLARCGSSPSTPPSGTFANVYQVTLKTTCIGCHIPGGSGMTTRSSTVDFSTQETAYSTLLSAKAVSGDAACNSVKMVVAGSPTTSYLIAVISEAISTNNFAGASGCQPYALHHSNQNLSDAEITSFKDWITNGAQNN